MNKLPLDHPTDPTNITLIKQSLRAEKLDLKLRYRLLISFGILFITSAIRTAFRFGFIGTVLITTPFFISFSWALYSSWRVKRAKRIPFLVLQQYMSVIPKSISGHFVKVHAKIAFIREETKVAHITAIDGESTKITISLHKLKDCDYIYDKDNQIVGTAPITVGDTVEVIGEVFLQSINNKKIAVLAAHSLKHYSESADI